MRDLEDLCATVAREGRIVRVMVVETRGSTPRAAGAAMLVWQDGQSGSIGGGRLEHEATHDARVMLAGGGHRRVLRQALGPALGQCCGGAVVLVFEAFESSDVERATEALTHSGCWARPIEKGDDNPPNAALSDIGPPVEWSDGWLIERRSAVRPVVIHGAGHVGRALALVLAPLPDLGIMLADARTELLQGLPMRIELSNDPLRAITKAPDTAAHVIVTHDHALDLELCHRLLSRHFASAGLIGSASKWTRFRQRLLALGHADTQISRISCPIGDPDLGKHPQAIALGVAATIIKGADAKATDRRRTA